MPDLPEVASPPPQPLPPRPAGRSPLAQTLLLLCALSIGVGVAHHIYADRAVPLTHIGTRTLSVQTAARPNHPSHPVLYLILTVRIANPREVPITLNDLGLTLTASDGTQTAASQIEREDLPALEAANPSLKDLIVAPIFRNAQLGPGKSLQGTILFAPAISESTWAARRSAILTLNFNHTQSSSTPIH